MGHDSGDGEEPTGERRSDATPAEISEAANTGPIGVASGDATPVTADPDAVAFGQSLPRRRAEPRVLAAFEVRYRSVNDVVTAYTRDVSRGGLFVATTRLLPVGAVVRLHLQMPEPEAAELRVVARVAYALDEKDAQGHDRPPGMGMELLDIGGTPIADEIARFLARVAPGSELPPPPSGVVSRILVVDDDAAARERTAELMRDAGHEVFVADNGVKALGMALQIQPDLVLSDVQMPVMDGWTLVRMLRARPSLLHVPVVFVTSLGSDEQRLQGYRLGVDDYIPKPFHEDELALRVQRVLTRSRAYPRNVAGAKALRGSLAHVQLMTLLSFLEVERRSGILLLVRPDAVATLYLRDGAVIRVDLPEELDHLLAADRVRCLLSWREGRFELADAMIHDEDTIGMSTSALLLEHAEGQDQ
ncbi:MAG TPA: response regulator [Kofleriaceae bacterium]|nr:response regulator [Kofleriaceae bacterium]